MPARHAGLENHCTFFGQTIKPGQLEINGAFVLVAYFFVPCVFPTLFDISARELTDLPVDFSVIEGQESVIRNILDRGTGKETIIAALNHFLIKKTHNAAHYDQRIKYAAQRIAGNPGAQILPEVLADIHMTERSFQRHFGNIIGISPNQYRRISQFSRALQQINRRAFYTLSDVAYQNGYADQSHFNRAFQEFTNIAAGNYLSSLPDS